MPEFSLQDEASFTAAVIIAGLSFFALGVPPDILGDPTHRAIALAYEFNLSRGNSPVWPAELPESARQALIEKAADRTDILKLAQGVLDCWRRREIASSLGLLIERLHESQQAAAGMTRETPQNVIVTATGVLAEAAAHWRLLLDPVPPLLDRPLYDMTRLAYLTAAELTALASAIDLIADGLVYPHADEGLLKLRAEQLREMAAPLKVPFNPASVGSR